ncbi:MAG: exosortase U [Planctomycetes bacterium]|nr:exosortase U [Planctomycetota bacterium]MBL7038819.1 exosortase U [Pirellulaceae bacterium]
MTSVSLESDQGSSQLFAGRPAQLVLAALLLASHLPFFILHLANLWRYQPHYEFFPVLLAAFAWLVWKRWPSEKVHTRASRFIAWFLLLLGLVCLGTSVILFSPWVGAVATVFSVGGLLLFLAGRAAFRQLASVWLLLWLVIPPPFRLDDQLIRLLQSLTARCGGTLLEIMGIEHLLAGNVFRLPGRELFVAEACSGINSQLVLVAASVILVILLRRAWLHSILLIAASVFWSVVVNTARVTFIVLVAVRWDIDLSDGWQHQVLGHALALAGILLLLSTDQLLAGLLASVLDFRRAAMRGEQERAPLARDPLSRLWNVVIACKWEKAPEPSEQFEMAAPPATAGKRSLLAAVPFGCLGALQLVLLLVPHTLEISADGLAATFQEDWLPQRLGRWERSEYRTHERERSSDDGLYSCQWVYQSEDHVATVSLDFPFFGWHELTRCYESRGWREEKRTVRQAKDGGFFVQVDLSKPNGEAGYLLFGLFDGAAQPIEPMSTNWPGIRGKLARSPLLPLLGLESRAITSTQTTLQIQVFVGSNYPLDQSQRQIVDDTYVDIRHRIVKRWQTDIREE